jgi:ABC-type multidrug transport system ATPase subunit
VSFQCASGEIVALLGPNGAGKSTLLAIAATALAPSAGSVRYDGREADASLRRRVGVVGHDLYLYPELTPVENLTFFGHLYRMPNLTHVVDAALDRAGLADRRHDPVVGFSRGMRQRLTLERALLHDPRLVLLDEPFTGLDDTATAALVRRLQELRAKGCLVLVATHDLEIVEGIIDRALMLREGRLLPLSSTAGSLRDRVRRAMSER